ncbi:MAG: Na+/H+ antiporter subunit G [Aquabacterium sp.]|jgi:multicomponent K+:H+ antiporter subunit G|uniref:Na+/H+ antiporter subunit G n=1 Tax=Aquabacterium sp. TaxID=1872578 RepID=UPI002A359AB8|nr:Na+/H+ antiporter subunit G [Aquabacterium sp.]MDX9843992.1 Na+/H+ antiporter subunit G [Aquabacterium sp.]
MNPELFGWVEVIVALLLMLSGLFTLAAAVGIVRFQNFFQRMHPPALAFSFSSWCVTLATILYFSARREQLALHAWLIIILLSITVPVTTILLSRTELFRRRTHGAPSPDIPPALSHILPPPTGADGASKQTHD